ncbi:MAG: c-type cytochrome [Methylovirgula sp.]|uniref:c-type cytochrome n=1 Tax=Methylovirgula sp. TaxID=1978224 RepID=UPI0030766566
MSDERLFSLRNKWFTTSVSATIFVVLISAFAGLIWFPLAQTNLKLNGIWDAICSAAGVARAPSSTAPVLSAFTTSGVIVTTHVLEHLSASAIGEGATLAQRCAICHGPEGMSGANAPNLAGQHAIVIYKELNDFQSGARTNGVMTPFAGLISKPEVLELAAYYSQLPPPAVAGTPLPPPKIVVEGEPMRDIAPCEACHGGMAEKVGAPRLDGQPAAYIKEQLLAFASGARHNDISEQMRNIARQMTPDEMDIAAHYYASLR